MRSMVSKLEGLLASKAREVQELEMTNESLRVRWATLHLSTRLMLELQQHQQVTAGAVDPGNAQILRVQSILASANGGGASAGAAHWPAGGAGVVGGGASRSSSGTAASASASAALSSLFGPGAGVRKAEAGGADAHGGGDGGGGGGGGPQADLLWNLDHLGPARNLLRLDGVDHEEVAEVERMDIREVKQRWTALVKEGLELLEQQRQQQLEQQQQHQQQQGRQQQRRQQQHEEPEQQHEMEACAAASTRAALDRLARRMDRMMGLVCLYNQEVFMAFMATRTDQDEGVMIADRPAAGGLGAAAAGRQQAAAGATPDAPLAIWEHLVEKAGAIRAQALLVMEFTDSFKARIEELRTRRNALLRELAQVSAGAAGAGGSFDAAQVSLSQAALLEEIEANTRAERRVIVVNAHAMRVVMTPLQLLKMWCMAYPWPINQLACITALQRRLKEGTLTFAEALE